LLVECAWSIIKIRNCYLADFYWKLKSKRGAKKAIVALARKLLVIIYNLLLKGGIYDEGKFRITREREEISRIKRLSNEAKKYGLELIPKGEINVSL
jgi:hypothetical protein